LKFIVIDGLDASGKSTQAIRLSRTLNDYGKTVCVRFHPSNDNFFGFKARQFLYSSGKSAHFASALFYMIDVIRSIFLYSWRDYDYVIFVRYLMGTAYLPSPLHKIAYHFFASVVPKSEAMFFIDTSPEEACRRIQKTRTRREMFESIDSLRKVRAKALSLALTDNWTIINGDKPIEDVGKQIKDALYVFRLF
jgi:dTMP kinase